MSTWNIYHKDGSKLTDVNEEQITVHGLEYSDSWMGECFVTINFKHEVPINFQIGDYIVYRGERFELNYEPGKDKQARPDTYGEGFVYDSVKFNALQDELARAEFLDVVLNDNELHYTSLPKFPFFVQTLDDLLDRIQANLDEQIGAGLWKIYSRNKERSVQRGALESEWLSVYGEKTEDNVIESMSITVDSKKCWDALALVNEKWDVNFIVRGRNIYVGTTGIEAGHIFSYGLGKGLYEIVQNADSDQSVITRLRAYGSEKNLPSHYYADLGIKYVANITKVIGASTNVELELDIDYIETYFKNKRKYVVSGESQEQSNGWVLQVTFDFQTTITGYVTQSGSSGKCRFYSELKGGQVDSGDEESKEKLDAFIAQVNAGNTKMYITSGLNKKVVPSSMKEYAKNLPNNMSINRLMLPGFPHVSLSDFYDSLTEQEKKYVNPTGKLHKFSTDPYRPYIDSLNIEEVGLRSASQFFDTDDKTNGVIEIYPTIEEMEIGGVRVDEIDEGVAPNDDGRFGDNETVKNVDIYLNKAIDFDINDLKDDDFSISMKDGMCGGRTFKVASSTKVDGRWRLTIERSKDDALELWFPYKDYPIKNGDHFVLTGITLPDSYVNAASLKLLKYAIALLDKNDYTRYVYQPKVDELFMARQHDLAQADETGTIKSLHDTLKAGDLMNFNDTDLNIEGIISIDQLTIKEEDGKIPTYDITLREDKEVGTIQKIQQQISSLQSGNGGTGAGLTTTQVKNQVATEGSKHFISKINDDTAKGTITWEKIQKFLQGLTAEDLSQFKKGATFGEFIQGMLLGTGGRIDELGNAEFESITSRSSIIAKELIVNRQTAMESNFVFTESGMVETVTEIPAATEGGNVTYDLKIQKRWDNDFTAFKENDVVLASINTLTENGKYYDMWLRVLSVNTVTNTITVVCYPDNECPSKKNYPPCELARLIRWGNAVDEERQSCWYISSSEGLLVWLDHVTKPIIDKTNYSLALGKLPDALSFLFQDFPTANKRDGAFYAKWMMAASFQQIDYQGNPIYTTRDRGVWSLAVAQGDNPYRNGDRTIDTVYYLGCKWKCLEDKTTKPPIYSSTAWAFVEGNPYFTLEMLSSKLWNFRLNDLMATNTDGSWKVFTTLSVVGRLYNQDVTDSMTNIVWTRETNNPTADNKWALSHANCGLSVDLTYEDLGGSAFKVGTVVFRCEAQIKDGETMYSEDVSVSF
nr:MAG TPA: tail protein [Bacteriophage sp.]DAQ65862.1 MAG TPA: tail protein [Bacteriophage sp.]